MKSWLWSGVVAVCMVPAVAVAAEDALARGQEVVTAFLRGETQSLWSVMTTQMQGALGSSEALASFRGSLMKSFGREEAVISEKTSQDGGFNVYTRLARWTGAPVPIQTVVAFDKAGQIAGFRIQAQPVAAPTKRLDYRTRATLRLPFEGVWHVFWGGRNIEENYHAVDNGQRFALDFVVVKDGRTHAGDPSVLGNYYCWDKLILAPADGTVVVAVDGLPDQPIGSMDPGNPAGNHVVLDFGNGEYGFLAHLKQGSVKVAPGEQVKAGVKIGRCGNSGNTSEPHLHFHLQTSPRLGDGEGLPAQFVNYQADGASIERGEPKRGQTIQPVS